MIYAYGASLPGTYHIKNDIVCQDSHKIIIMGKDIAVAAVADGLGSAAHSDEGSKIAAKISTEYCSKHITATTEEQQILNIIRASFTLALNTIEKEANKKDRAVDLYDTTLTLAVLIRDTLYYGHSGDSGMIALTIQGKYEQVTKQQRDEQGRVFPLFFTDKWEFACFKSKVSSVLLATDGIFEIFFPIYIKNAPINIHVTLAQFFMDNKGLRIHKLGQKAVQTRMKEVLEQIPDEQINDDKTIAVLINTSVKIKRQPKDYYQEPDWVALKNKYDDEWRRAAYPDLYKDETLQLNNPNQGPFTTTPRIGLYTEVFTRSLETCSPSIKTILNNSYLKPSCGSVLTNTWPLGKFSSNSTFCGSGGITSISSLTKASERLAGLVSRP